MCAIQSVYACAFIAAVRCQLGTEVDWKAQKCSCRFLCAYLQKWKKQFEKEKSDLVKESERKLTEQAKVRKTHLIFKWPRLVLTEMSMSVVGFIKQPLAINSLWVDSLLQTTPLLLSAVWVKPGRPLSVAQMSWFCKLCSSDRASFWLQDDVANWRSVMWSGHECVMPKSYGCLFITRSDFLVLLTHFFQFSDRLCGSSKVCILLTPGWIHKKGSFRFPALMELVAVSSYMEGRTRG